MELRDAETLARRLMREHELDEWGFGFDNGKERFGLCRYPYKRRRSDGGTDQVAGHISLSRHLTQLNSEADVHSTILHEIAHALAWEMYGRAQGHNKNWKAVARSIGHTGNRCYDSSKVQQPPPNWLGVCPGCGLELERYRRRRVACKACCVRHNNGKWTEEFLFVWEDLREGRASLRIHVD